VLDDFDRVYRQHLAPVWRYVRARVPDSAEAEDLTSEVFLRAARAWPTYDSRKGAVLPWLLGIARHVAADWWRRRPPVPVAEVGEGEAGDAEAEPTGDVEAEALRGLGAEELRRHFAVLTDREREAIALRYGAGLASAEVGELLGISDAGARMLVHRAVVKLREELEHG
jgi:RNA polymerase sigma-70 factor (ECF subfamily)